MISNNHEEYFKEYLVDTLKLCAQTIIDNAEEIIGNYMFTGELEIRIDMCTNKSVCSPPDIIINKDYLPDLDKYAKIYDKMHDEEVKKDINKVKRSFQECQKDIYKGIVGDIQV